jgi:polyisoprenyl-phosphate glycosyltransferase
MNHMLKPRENLASLCLVIPVFNEEKMVPLLVETLRKVFNEKVLAEHRISKIHYIFVDDGSHDKTIDLLIKNGVVLSSYEIVVLSRNFGHQSAVGAGLQRAVDFDLTAVIDADLQDPPEVILGMLKEWRKGFDVVYGERRKRKEAFYMVMFYWIFYRVYSFLSPIKVAVDSGDFGLMDRKVVLALQALPERQRFMRALRSWVGFKQTGYPYERPARAAGETKYTFRRLYKLATDGIASVSIRPLQIAQTLSLLYLLSAGVAIAYLLKQWGGGGNKVRFP